MQSAEEKRPPGLKPAFISRDLCGPEGPLFHGDARIREFFRSLLGHTNDDTTWPSYKIWLNKVRQEAEEHRACCLEPSRLQTESLVRTLDKALFTIGQGLVRRAEREEARKKRLAVAQGERTKR